jgi:hypothetical protein
MIRKSELKKRVRQLKDNRKNFYCLTDEKGNLIDPAADGERAVRLDEVIEKLKNLLKG